MDDTKIENKASYNSWAAAIDAAKRNAVNAARYDTAARTRAEAMKQALSVVYNADEFYVSYRKKFIAIKIAEAEVVDQAGLTLLEEDWEKQGISTLRSDQGIIYRIPAKH